MNTTGVLEKNLKNYFDSMGHESIVFDRLCDRDIIDLFGNCNESELVTVLKGLFLLREKYQNTGEGNEPFGQSYALFLLIAALKNKFTSHHSQILLDILLWKEVSSDPDHSLQHTILHILGNIADPAIIPALKSLADQPGMDWSAAHCAIVNILNRYSLSRPILAFENGK